MAGARWKAFGLAAALGAALGAAACAEKPLSDGPGGIDPKECFAKVRKVQERQEWKSLPEHYVPESLGTLLGAAIVPWAEIRRDARKSGKPEPEDVHFVEGILREKGIALDAVVKALDGGPAAVDKLLEGVIDRRALFAQVMVQTAGCSGYKRPKLISIEDVVVDGETARGDALISLGDAPPSKVDTRFRRFGGRWFMDLSPAK